MKKNAFNSAMKMLVTGFIAVAAMFNTAYCQLSMPDIAINTYKMAAASGQKLQFRLPKDIRSGDVITGSVVE